MLLGLLFGASLFVHQQKISQLPAILRLFSSECWLFWTETYRIIGQLARDHGLRCGMRLELHPYLGALVLGLGCWILLSIILGFRGFFRDFLIFFPLKK